MSLWLGHQSPLPCSSHLMPERFDQVRLHLRRLPEHCHRPPLNYRRSPEHRCQGLSHPYQQQSRRYQARWPDHRMPLHLIPAPLIARRLRLPHHRWPQTVCRMRRCYYRVLLRLRRKRWHSSLMQLRCPPSPAHRSRMQLRLRRLPLNSGQWQSRRRPLLERYRLPLLMSPPLLERRYQVQSRRRRLRSNCRQEQQLDCPTQLNRYLERPLLFQKRLRHYRKQVRCPPSLVRQNRMQSMQLRLRPSSDRVPSRRQPLLEHCRQLLLNYPPLLGHHCQVRWHRCLLPSNLVPSPAIAVRMRERTYPQQVRLLPTRLHLVRSPLHQFQSLSGWQGWTCCWCQLRHFPPYRVRQGPR